MIRDNTINYQLSTINYMPQAYKLAQQAAAMGEVPVGCVVVKNNEVIAAAFNKVEQEGDITNHAELLAIKQASAKLGNKYLTNCDLYVTLEPCPMCAQAISNARIKKLYFGAYDTKSGGVENGARIFEQSSCHHKPEVIGGIMEDECKSLIQTFFRDLR